MCHKYTYQQTVMFYARNDDPGDSKNIMILKGDNSEAKL